MLGVMVQSRVPLVMNSYRLHLVEPNQKIQRALLMVKMSRLYVCSSLQA